MSEKILVSACLLGEPVRYDGGSNENKMDKIILQKLRKWKKTGKVISVCPELLAGFPIPRLPKEIRGEDGGEGVLDGKAKVIDAKGKDVSEEFIKSTELVLQLVREHNIKLAILKARSPACGSKQIYNGCFSGTLKKGMGVTTALLHRAGVRVFNEEDVQNLKW